MYDTDDYSEENKKKFSILFFIEINKKYSYQMHHR